MMARAKLGLKCRVEVSDVASEGFASMAMGAAACADNSPDAHVDADVHTDAHAGADWVILAKAHC